MKRSKMKRGSKRHYSELGKLGAGKAKTFVDEEAAKEQRRLAGIASGKARKEKARIHGGQAHNCQECGVEANDVELSAIASQIQRLNESAKAFV